MRRVHPTALLIVSLLFTGCATPNVKYADLRPPSTATVSGNIVTVHVGSDDEFLTVAITDEGMGIPADKLPRIFDKFERVDNRDTREVGGTGIGLFLVKHLVERHGGEVWAQSEYGKGSTFSFRVPIEPDVSLEEIDDV